MMSVQHFYESSVISIARDDDCFLERFMKEVHSDLQDKIRIAITLRLTITVKDNFLKDQDESCLL